MSRVKKALNQRDGEIKLLRWIIFSLMLLLALCLYGWSSAPSRLLIDIPPDLRSGSTRGIHERHPFNIYAFGLYIFQQMHNWPKEGTDDYQAQIERLSCYITPKFKEYLLNDYQKKLMSHELQRTRTLTEMVDKPYNDKRVHIESNQSWVVFYDVNIQEHFKRETVKDIFLRYGIRIIQADVNPECNFWGLKLDGFYQAPKRLEGHMIKTNQIKE